MKCLIEEQKIQAPIPNRGVPNSDGVYYCKEEDAYLLNLPNLKTVVWNSNCINHCNSGDLVSWAEKRVWVRCPKGTKVVFIQDK